MIQDLIHYKLASREFRRKAVHGGVSFIGDDCPEWDALEKAWERLVFGRPRLERFISNPWVYQWIS